MAGQLSGADVLAGVIAEVGQQAGGVSVKPGEMLVDSAGNWTFSSGGSPVKAIFVTSAVPYPGAPAVAVVQTPPVGMSTAWVIGMTQEGASQGATGKITVVNGDGLTVQVEVERKLITATRLAHYTPAVNDSCLIDYKGGKAYTLGKIGTATIAPPPPTATIPPPPPPPQTGTSYFGATDSGTWTSGYNWNSYFGQHCYSGSGYVPPSSGNWLYGGATRGLGDKGTITRVQFYLAARKQAGNYNSAATVHFYRHTSDSKGGAEPSRTHGPHDVSIPAGWGGGYIDLPASFGEALKGGGGISIAGDPYVGFTGLSGAGNSGHLAIDWRKG